MFKNSTLFYFSIYVSWKIYTFGLIFIIETVYLIGDN
jgi:hypothetical protein